MGITVAEEAVQKWGGGGYLSYRTHFVWRKLTFLWSDSKNWGGLNPLCPPISPPLGKDSTKKMAIQLYESGIM